MLAQFAAKPAEYAIEVDATGASSPFLHHIKQDGGRFPAAENEQPGDCAAGWVVSAATRLWIG